jgi:DNA-binding PadR family transcriptional regulator
LRQHSSPDPTEAQTDGDDLLRDFLLGFVKIHVLQHASRAPVYGFALIDELGRHGYRLGPGSLYPLLHRLERAGFIARVDRIVGGRIRKYCISTEAGERALDEARMKIRELVDEVLVSDDGRADYPNANT